MNVGLHPVARHPLRAALHAIGILAPRWPRWQVRGASWRGKFAGLARADRKGAQMFTIEHEFDASVITLVDEGAAPLQEDVIINTFEDCITVTQYDPQRDAVVEIRLSLEQVRDLGAALDLPEGVYRLRPAKDVGKGS